MPYEIVHTIGSTIYFVFVILFLWMSGIPRTNPGATWWAAAMFAALSARVAFFSLTALHFEGRDVAAVYWGLNVFEKLFLVLGLVCFFNTPLKSIWLWAVTIAVEAWLFVAWSLGSSIQTLGFGAAIFNAGFLCYVAWTAYRKRHEFHPRLMLVTAATSGLLALHWATAFMVIHFVPSWSITGFMLGTFLVLIQYLSLLAAILRSLQQRLLEAEAKALDMAFQDPLTGLSNRRYVSTLFDKVLALAKRPRQLVAVIYIDLDDFKPINDRAGHKVGDEVLRVTASRLKQATRSTDICARLGGDEFVAICTQLDEADQVHVIVDKIMSSLTAPIPIKGEQYVVGASIGISLYPLHGDSLLQLVEHADVAMYQVKQSGKSGYRIYEATPNPPRTPVAAT